MYQDSLMPTIDTEQAQLIGTSDGVPGTSLFSPMLPGLGRAFCGWSSARFYDENPQDPGFPKTDRVSADMLDIPS